MATKTINISHQGVYWGFDDPVVVISTPEPSTWALLAAGTLLLLPKLLRRKRAPTG